LDKRGEVIGGGTHSGDAARVGIVGSAARRVVVM